MKMKRFVAFLLCAVMTMSVLAGCGASGSEADVIISAMTCSQDCTSYSG